MTSATDARTAGPNRQSASDPHLRYLPATMVQGPCGMMAGALVRDRSVRPLGTLEGLVVDPPTRSVRYIVVKPIDYDNRRRHVLPWNSGSLRIDSDGHGLWLDVPSDPRSRCERFDTASVQPFSDDDLITMIFAPLTT